jgi:LytS/YehU family sensor histidine kinase
VILVRLLPGIRAEEYAIGAIRLSAGLVVVGLSYALVRRIPWPRPFRWRFALLHIAMAPVAAMAWVALSTPLELLLAPGGTDLVGSERFSEFMFLGSFMYALVVGVSYAAEGSARVARAEAVAARTQLAALRSQLHPHFLFNALHTVVQLIPIDPARAGEAAEQVGELLRIALEEERDEVTVADEWRFVSRYLDIEQIRFGERLVVRTNLAEDVLGERIPSFALQTLVENAVQHGAARRADATQIDVTGSRSPSAVKLTVRNECQAERGAAEVLPVSQIGTGLVRLRERLGVLYGDRATLECGPAADGDFEAVLTIHRRAGQ